MTNAIETRPALQVRDLGVAYRMAGRQYAALRDIDLDVGPGEIMGVVGESGCGKSTLAAAILGILPPGGSITAGTVDVCGTDVAAIGGEELRRLRGPGASMIFQDPFTSLNPAFTVGYQLCIVQAAHDTGGSRREQRRLAQATLTEAGIPDAAAAMAAHPHELSGGQRQRVMIAMALLLKPKLLIADEPTSALDVTMEAQILTLLRKLRDDHGTAIVFVSHDLGSVAQLCDAVTIMYGGRVVESAPTGQLYASPQHPYTRALLEAVPSWRRRVDNLATILGRPPSLTDELPGCVFAPRCGAVRDACTAAEPALLPAGGGVARCLIHDPESEYRAQPDLVVGAEQ
ncbi:ABC transporter ATP-binding protein [Nocardioidaceae bacterium SCSIO 66511]|nr:ABC transporter ATP-binding protein [Nocardioidaceae bacterium SCSIO 66511]